MRKLANKIKNARLRKLPVIAALAAALVVPGVIRAYAEEDPVDLPEENIVVANINEDGNLVNEEPEAPAEDTPPAPEDPSTDEIPTTPEDVIVEDVVDENIENDETAEDPLPAEESPVETLQRYIDFAMAEHPGVEVAEVKFVWKNGVKSAKIIFEDGWKVYIGVSDGRTLSVADEDNKVHRCQRRMKHLKAYRNWHKSHKSYYQWWVDQRNQGQGEDSNEDNSETEQSSVQDSNTRNKKDKGTQHYTDRKYRR